ncbi:MAG TPA: LysM domain-containing protein, partial [Gammaproteobacteria bacterium]|nr:LysM domain-containing protein [Gammaproteobacteria bacterium]
MLCLLCSCASEPVKAPIGDRTQRPVRHPDSHRVRQGDTLYSISFLYGISVDELVAWNHLRKPYTIFKGQKLRLSPPPVTRKKTVPPPVRPTPRASKPKIYHPPAAAKKKPAEPGRSRAEPVVRTHTLP